MRSNLGRLRSKPSGDILGGACVTSWRKAVLAMAAVLEVIRRRLDSTCVFEWRSP